MGEFVAKPRFLLAAGGLETVNQPVLEGESLVRALSDPESEVLLRHDYWAIPGDLEPRPWQRLRVARVAATVASLYRRRELRERLYTGSDARGIELTVAIADAFRRDAEKSGACPWSCCSPMLDLLSRYPDEDALPLVRALRARPGRDRPGPPHGACRTRGGPVVLLHGRPAPLRGGQPPRGGLAAGASRATAGRGARRAQGRV